MLSYRIKIVKVIFFIFRAYYKYNMMKKWFYLLTVLLGLCTLSKAAPGDTTWVQGNIANLDNYGSYDSLLTFPGPGKTYRKIYMIFTLGKHTCGSATYCGDWDYTVQNYLMVPGGDTLELGRLITPYANAGAPRTPWTWLQHYVYDVTDYASLLTGSEAVRIFYSGYSGGFTANIRFAFIEGTPERTAINVKKLWGGSFGYGGVPDINSHFPALTETAASGVVTPELKFTVTGHGSDANGCCEFMPHNYQVMLNGSSVANTTIWRDNCGSNELYPQSGTWLYNRGNWCPGAMVYSNFHILPGISAGTPYNVALQFDPYTGSGGSYTTEATLINYGAVNKTLDASIEEIIAPTNNENHFRENPVCGSPVIHIRNTGSTPISSITFQYGLLDSAMSIATWYGTINSMQDTDVILPQLFQLKEISGTSGTYTFVAHIQSVNGRTDDDTTNNTMATSFISAPRWPSTIKVVLSTNNEALKSNTSQSETSWIIYDQNNAIYAQRSDASISTLYSDTVNFTPGLYKLVIYDSSCDGLQWWVHASGGGDGVTAGYLNVKKLPNVNIPMNGYNYSGTYNNDFGCSFTQYFYTGTPVDHTGINNISENNVSIEAYPNPARNVVNVDINGMQQVRGTILLIDGLGRTVYTAKCSVPQLQINTGNLVNGVYTILFVNDFTGNKLTARILIAK
jgi:hypothetical protein